MLLGNDFVSDTPSRARGEMGSSEVGGIAGNRAVKTQEWKKFDGFNKALMESSLTGECCKPIQKTLMHGVFFRSTPIFADFESDGMKRCIGPMADGQQQRGSLRSRTRT